MPAWPPFAALTLWPSSVECAAQRFDERRIVVDEQHTQAVAAKAESAPHARCPWASLARPRPEDKLAHGVGLRHVVGRAPDASET